MNQPIWVLRAGDAPVLDLCAEILCCEGFPWFEELLSHQFDLAPPGVEVLLLAGSPVGTEVAHALAQAVHSGVALIAITPDPTLAAAFGLAFQSGAPDTHLAIKGLRGWEHGPLPLLCPDDTARPLQGGAPLAALQDAQGVRCGAGLVQVPLGRGRAWFMGYDLLQVIASLRHGTGRLDELPDGTMGPLAGPRHLYSYVELSDKLPRDVPVADLHQDVLRTLLLEALAATPLPRLWHFPGGAPALWFVKGDGCGEAGAEVVVRVAERGGAYLSFYRPRESRHSGALMREWRSRGHGISVEADLSHITQARAPGATGRRRSVEELNRCALGAIRTELQAHRDAFLRETDLEMDTLCIHSCQWTGAPMARLIHDLGWRTPTHFISHDPRMRYGQRYGPYMIPTALPLRYFEPSVGLQSIWHLPAQWDESQTIGQHAELLEERPPAWPGFRQFPESRPFLAALEPARARGMVGLTAEVFGAVLSRFAHEAATRWHGVQICNFHPIYVAIPQDHPRASRRALELGLAGARAAGCRFANLEDWSRFMRARAGVRLVGWCRQAGVGRIDLVSAAPLKELALLLPDGVTRAQLAHNGAELPIRRCRLEGRLQRMVILDLQGRKPTSLYLIHPETDRS